MYINVQARTRGICRSRGECFLPIMRVPIERSEIQETTCQNEFTFDPCTLYIRFVHTMQSIGSCRLPFPLSDCGTSVWRPPLRFISTKFRRILIMYVTCSNLWYMYIHIHIYVYIRTSFFREEMACERDGSHSCWKRELIIRLNRVKISIWNRFDQFKSFH